MIPARLWDESVLLFWFDLQGSIAFLPLFFSGERVKREDRRTGRKRKGVWVLTLVPKPERGKDVLEPVLFVRKKTRKKDPPCQ